MNKKKIGKRIVEYRKKKQLTQQDLANKLDVTNRTIINWENGKYFPDYALLLPLCEALDVSINELLTGEEDKEQKANATTELILNYLDRNRNENLNEYKKYGKILLIGGLILMLIGVQIPRTFVRGVLFIYAIEAMYPVIGFIFSFVGFKFITKRLQFKKRFIYNFLYFVAGILFLVIADFISVEFYNKVPRYYVNNITNYEKSKSFDYYETLFFDAYKCDYYNFEVVPFSIERYDENDFDYLINKYCDNNIGGENQ